MNTRTILINSRPDQQSAGKMRPEGATLLRFPKRGNSVTWGVSKWLAGGHGSKYGNRRPRVIFHHKSYGAKWMGPRWPFWRPLKGLPGFATQCRLVPDLGRFSPVGSVTKQRNPLSLQRRVTIKGPLLNQTRDGQVESGYCPE